MFACVPMPTLRAMLSKNLPPQQYGKVATKQKQKLKTAVIISDCM